jgi:DNA replication and repair protein RecF
MAENMQFCCPMPFLKKISLLQFKNYPQADFAFPERITGISGANGTGKTNLLDAIYYLCFTKSYFAGSDAQLVKKGCFGFRISGQFTTLQGGEHDVTAILRENGKKEIGWDGDIYPRVSAHIGKLPAVVIAPDDVEIITGASEARRKLADAMLCQLNDVYLQHLMQYNKILQQRNSLLKQMAENPVMSEGVLDVLDRQLAEKGASIFEKRKATLDPFLQKATEHYARIAGNTDEISLQYVSQLGKSNSEEKSQILFLSLLQANRSRDKAMQRTTTGIHRDDMQFEMMGQPFKQTASQGQRKSMLFALKLTEFEWLEKSKGFPPILLLDDVFEKLDESRMQNLLKEVCLEKKGQVFITDTHADRLRDSLSKLTNGFGLITL